MRCKSCDYPLWQIRDRRCPECGTEFKPSEFEFVLNSVRFCCPHCNQSYYGTGPNGHLVPREFDCVACHRHISMDEMVLRPTEGVREEQTKVEMNPWLERRDKGLVRGWFNTVIQSMGTPGRLIRATPEQSSLPQAIWYATATNAFYLLTGMSLLILLFLVIGVISAWTGSGGPGGGGIAGAMAPVAVFVGWAIGMVVVMILGAFMWGAIAHGLLRLTGPTAAGIGRTMQCIFYSSGTNIANAVPCLGFYIGWLSTIWWAVSATLMLKEGQKVSGGRATLAAVLPIGLALLLAVGGIIFLIVMPIRTAVATAQAAVVQAQASQAAQVAGATDLARITELAQAITTHVEQYNAPPKHAAELLDSQGVPVSLFLEPGPSSFDRLETTTIVGMSLNTIALADRAGTDAVIAAANASLPDTVIAHRIGDTVFCYHGIDFKAVNPALWTVISSPEPGTAAQSDIVVGHVDGTAETFAAGTFEISLSHQNALRADASLPPLPEPSTVTAGKPAVKE